MTIRATTALCYLVAIIFTDGLAPIHQTSSNVRNGATKGDHGLKVPNFPGFSYAVAGAVFTGALLGEIVAPVPPANADVELSRGAVVVRTTTSADSLLKSEIDSQKLIRTLFANRKEISSSLGRMKEAIRKEVDSPLWNELKLELTGIEGDILSSIEVIPPADWKETVKDLANGKFNFLFNGEIVNVALEPSFGEEEDDLVIKIKGFKGEKIAGTSFEREAPKLGPVRSKLAEYEDFWIWWNAPTELVSLKGMQTSNGNVVATGAASAVGLVYVGSYAYYQSEIEREEEEAAAKKAAARSKTKKKAMAINDEDDKKQNNEPSEEIVTESVSPVQRRGWKFWKRR